MNYPVVTMYLLCSVLGANPLNDQMGLEPTWSKNTVEMVWKQLTYIRPRPRVTFRRRIVNGEDQTSEHFRERSDVARSDTR